MSNKVVELIFLGKKYKISCDAGEEESLLSAARELQTRANQLKLSTKGSNPEQISMLVALNLCYELQQKELEINTNNSDHTEIERISDNIEEKISNLINLLDFGIK